MRARKLPKINVPNQLTILRLICAVPFVALLIAVAALPQRDELIASPAHYHLGDTRTILFVVAGAIFVGAMITDWIDGYLARKHQQVTTFGKLFDPLADKMMTTTALVLLSAIGLVPIYLTIIVIARDLVVDGARNVLAANHVELAASRWGKLKTITFSLALPIIFFLVPVFDEVVTDLVNPSTVVYLLNIPVFIGTVLALVSGYQYLLPLKKYLNLK